MNISTEYHDIILEEYRSIEQVLKRDLPVEDKIYFFSATYGILNRVMNLSYDPLLVFMHQVLQTAHQGFLNRLNKKNPTMISTSLPDDLTDALFSYFTLLIEEFEKKNEIGIRETLEKISNVTYATTGNGFYLYLQERLKI